MSTGGVSSQQRPVDGRAFQATFSDQIRNELGIPTMAVGGIVSHADINTIVAAGRADMCALGARLIWKTPISLAMPRARRATAD